MPGLRVRLPGGAACLHFCEEDAVARADLQEIGDRITALTSKVDSLRRFL